MAQKSVFDPTNNDDRPIQGGLDRFLGPPAGSYSHMPGDLIDGKTGDESSPEVEAQTGDPERGDWGTNPDEPVQQIREALDEKLATEEAKAKAEDVDSYPTE